MVLSEIMEKKEPHADSWSDEHGSYVDILDGDMDLFMETDEYGKITMLCSGLRK